MSGDRMFHRTPLAAAVDALRRDLLDENGPRISTMRNYRFAILAYHPTDEYRLRAHVQDLVAELSGRGWFVLPIDLHAVLLERVRGLGDDVVAQLVAAEQALAEVDRDRALKVLRDRLAHLIEGPTGLAADVSRIVTDFARAHPGEAERSLVVLGRAGALYPFFRYSSLLKHLDGRTGGLPVVLLYPGTAHDGGLSFMDVLPPDRDYRPRIYV